MSVSGRIPLLLPEHIVINTINQILIILREDYKEKIAAGREEENMLHLLLYGQTIEKIDMYKEAVSIFITTPQNPKHFNATLSFDHNDTKAPQIYITQPSENEKNGSLQIGEGDQDELTFARTAPEQDEYRTQYMRRYMATHYVVIVCENRIEMTIIYNVLKSMIVSCMNHFALEGLSNLKIGGQELKMRSEIPDRLFQKGITMSFEYEQVAPTLVLEQVYRKIRIFWEPEGSTIPQGPIEISNEDDLNSSSNS